MATITGRSVAIFLRGLLLQLLYSVIVMACILGAIRLFFGSGAGDESTPIGSMVLGGFLCVVALAGIHTMLRVRGEVHQPSGAEGGQPYITSHTPQQNFVAGGVLVVVGIALVWLSSGPEPGGPIETAEFAVWVAFMFVGSLQIGLGVIQRSALHSHRRFGAEEEGLPAEPAGPIDAEAAETLTPQQQAMIDDVHGILTPWIAKHTRRAWRPVLERGDGAPADSKYGGVPWLAVGEKWPTCTACNAPMPLFLQLHSDQVPPDIGRRFGPGLLQFFYCTAACESDRAAWEPFSEGTMIRVIALPLGPAADHVEPPEVAFPEMVVREWTEFDDLPSPEEHEELGVDIDCDDDDRVVVACPEFGIKHRVPAIGTDDDWSAVVESVGRCVSGEKIGGWPDWLQRQEYPQCPRCGTRMEHLAQFESHETLPYGFGDMGCGHITQCPQHREVFAFGWACH